jgi:hypothetical protein
LNRSINIAPHTCFANYFTEYTLHVDKQLFTCASNSYDAKRGGKLHCKNWRQDRAKKRQTRPVSKSTAPFLVNFEQKALQPTGWARLIRWVGDVSFVVQRDTYLAVLGYTELKQGNYSGL